jgi:hypothetical protein
MDTVIPRHRIMYSATHTSHAGLPRSNLLSRLAASGVAGSGQGQAKRARILATIMFGLVDRPPAAVGMPHAPTSATAPATTLAAATSTSATAAATAPGTALASSAVLPAPARHIPKRLRPLLPVLGKVVDNCRAFDFAAALGRCCPAPPDSTGGGKSLVALLRAHTPPSRVSLFLRRCLTAILPPALLDAGSDTQYVIERFRCFYSYWILGSDTKPLNLNNNKKKKKKKKIDQLPPVGPTSRRCAPLPTGSSDFGGLRSGASATRWRGSGQLGE